MDGREHRRRWIKRPKKGFHPLLGVPLRFTEYPPKGMRFARNESDAHLFPKKGVFNPPLRHFASLRWIPPLRNVPRTEWIRCSALYLFNIKKGWQTNALVEIQGIAAIFQLLQAVEFKVSWTYVHWAFQTLKSDEAGCPSPSVPVTIPLIERDDRLF